MKIEREINEEKIVIKSGFVFLLSFCLFFLVPIQTRATEVGGNTDQEDGGEASQKVIGGPTFEHTGWLPTSLMKSVISLLIPRYFIAALPSLLSEMGAYY